MKRLNVYLVMVAVCGAVFCGCGEKAASFDVTELGSALNSQITYQDELMLMDTDTASMFLNLSDINIVNSAIYEGAGATAEEIVVLECASAEDARKAENMMKDRVAEQKESFVDYVPEEVNKLNEAIIVTNGNYAVLSVSNDTAGAKKIIEQYMK